MRRHVVLALLAACATAPARAVTLDADYVLSSHGFRLLAIATHTQLTTAGYAISAHSRTVGLVGFLSHSDVSSVASGRFDGIHVQPERYASTGRSRGADRDTEIAYTAHDPVVTVLRPLEPERDPVPAARTRGSIDTLSAMIGLSRQVAETGRCDGTALVFDGHRLSRLDARTVGSEPVPNPSGAGFSGTALRCDFTSRQLAGFLHDANRARLMKPLHGSAWLAAPVPGAPVAAVRATFESPLFGTATLTLAHAVLAR